MSTVTGMTAAAMQAIADDTIHNATVNDSGDLILTKNDLTTVNAGHVVGATGATGAAGSDGADGTTLDLHALTIANPTSANWSNNSKKIQGVADGTLAQDAATVGQSALKAGTAFTGAVVEAAVALTFATTIALDASLGNTFRVTLTASTGTLGAPSNPTDNQKIVVEVTQDGTGSRTLAYNSVFQFPTANPAPTLSTAANSTDWLMFIYNSSKTKWRFAGALLGFT